MIAGHFGLAAAVKAREQRAPLWALMLATAWLDVVFVPLFLTGVETIEPAPGGAATGYGASVIHADYTHSLVGAVLLSVLFGAAGALRWGKHIGAVLGTVAFSHWVLDLIVHRADMPLLPGDVAALPKLGLGLWRYPLASMLLELAIVVIGSALYFGAASHVAKSTGGSRIARANFSAIVVLASGLLILFLDFTGMMG
jgi:hypothetical protein